MNLCPNCSEELEIKSNFCPKCGYGLHSPLEPANIKRTTSTIKFSLIGMLLSVIIALGILSLTDFELYSFSFLYVIPVGALALGMITTTGYFFRIVNEGYKPSRQNYLASLGIVLVTFFFIQYGDYRMTYVTEDNEINHQFKGDPINYYADEDGNALTFNHYIAHGYVIMRHYSRDEEDGSYRENDNKKIVLPTMGAFAAQALSYVKAM